MTEAIIKSKELISELKAIRADLEYIKEHMINSDMIMSDEEELLLETALENHRKGKTVSLEDFKRKLGD